jgi:hypothetical protein
MSNNDDERLGLPSASVMHRLAKCSGSAQMIASLNDNVIAMPDRDALTGTRIHAALAGEKRAIESLTEREMATMDKCVELRERVIRLWALGEEDLKELIEERLFYRRGLEPLFSGRLDYVVIDEKRDRALIIDYKTGRTESTAAADNMQLRTQAVLLYHNDPRLVEIEACIVEPYVSWRPQRVRYNFATFKAAEQQIVAIVEASQGAIKLSAGTHCAYCAACAFCSEAQAYALSVPQEHESRISELPRGADGVKLFEGLKAARKIIDRLEERFEGMMIDNPDALPGYTLPERGRERVVVAYPRRLKDAFIGLLSEDEIDGCASYHLNKIKELYGLKHKLTGQSLDDEFAKLVESAAGALSVQYDKPYIRPLTAKEKRKLIES